ncbi:MAG TPA: hypothetical protein VMV93_07755 [Chloroflexota bacterium]|nr:hypothetical protein [Chloroflexota bacterium]
MSTTDAENSLTESQPSPRGNASVQTVARDGSELTDWQRFFLERLDVVLNRQAAAVHDEATTEEQRKLLSKTVYSTLLDCQQQGVTELALKRIAGQTTESCSAN